METMIIWDKYDNKYRDVVDVEVAKGLEADLYEANNRINDLLDIVKKKDAIIDEMAYDRLHFADSNYLENIFTVKDLIKYYEERCNK